MPFCVVETRNSRGGSRIRVSDKRVLGALVEVRQELEVSFLELGGRGFMGAIAGSVGLVWGVPRVLSCSCTHPSRTLQVRADAWLCDNGCWVPMDVTAMPHALM